MYTVVCGSVSDSKNNCINETRKIVSELVSPLTRTQYTCTGHFIVLAVIKQCSIQQNFIMPENTEKLQFTMAPWPEKIKLAVLRFMQHKTSVL